MLAEDWSLQTTLSLPESKLSFASPLTVAHHSARKHATLCSTIVAIHVQCCPVADALLRLICCQCRLYHRCRCQCLSVCRISCDLLSALGVGSFKFNNAFPRNQIHVIRMLPSVGGLRSLCDFTSGMHQVATVMAAFNHGCLVHRGCTSGRLVYNRTRSKYQVTNVQPTMSAAVRL